MKEFFVIGFCVITLFVSGVGIFKVEEFKTQQYINKRLEQHKDYIDQFGSYKIINENGCFKVVNLPYMLLGIDNKKELEEFLKYDHVSGIEFHDPKEAYEYLRKGEDEGFYWCTIGPINPIIVLLDD